MSCLTYVGTSRCCGLPALDPAAGLVEMAIRMNRTKVLRIILRRHKFAIHCAERAEHQRRLVIKVYIAQCPKMLTTNGAPCLPDHDLQFHLERDRLALIASRHLSTEPW